MSDGSGLGVAKSFCTLMWHGEVSISPISGRKTVMGGQLVCDGDDSSNSENRLAAATDTRAAAGGQ